MILLTVEFAIAGKQDVLFYAEFSKILSYNSCLSHSKSVPPLSNDDALERGVC